MEEDFRALLLAASGVTALVQTRVDWLTRPQKDPYPAIVLTVVSDNPTQTYTGPDALRQSTVQVDCYALTYLSAKALSRAVIAVLNGYRTGRFQAIFYNAARETRDGGTNDVDRPYRVSLDFMLNWR